MEIYDVAIDKGIDRFVVIRHRSTCLHTIIVVPTLADIRLRLTEGEAQQWDISGTVSTITEGLAIEHSLKSECLFNGISGLWAAVYQQRRKQTCLSEDSDWRHASPHLTSG